jgi:hypothetical protein
VVSTNYTGRLIDQLIFSGAKAGGVQPIELSWQGDAGGLICTGVQKVAQTWLILFLTEEGSVLGDVNRGTQFLTYLRQGRIQTGSDVESYFAIASDKVKRTMDIDAEGRGLPDDERLDDAFLRDFEISQALSRLYLKVYIRTIAGEGREIFVPVPVSIR